MGFRENFKFGKVESRISVGVWLCCYSTGISEKMKYDRGNPV